jgi:hypothetical protein
VCSGRGEVDGRVARAGGDEQPQPGQPVEGRTSTSPVTEDQSASVIATFW